MLGDGLPSVTFEKGVHRMRIGEHEDHPGPSDGSISLRKRCRFWFLALILFPSHYAKAGWPPLVPPSYRIVYNLQGDHRFHFVRTLPGAGTRTYLLGAGAPLVPQACTTVGANQINLTECGGTLPLLSATDGTALSASSYLMSIQAVNGGSGSDGNTPLQILNQANSTGGATLPTPITGGFGGIDIIQNAVATGSPTVTSYSSPFLQLCAQEWTGSPAASHPDCWLAQVVAGSGANATDVFEWTRQTSNTTTNITMLWPTAINLASHGQMTVGPEPITGANANVPSTFTGQKTSNGTASAAAGPITVEPGQLTAATAVSGMTEGALQILQSYISSGTITANRLACPSGTAQEAMVCNTTGAAENWVGVFNNIVGAQDITVTPLRYGRVLISNSSSLSAQSVPWTSGDFVCKDDANASFVLDNSIANSGTNTPCPLGESVGLAVGDPSGTTSPHLVDLIPEASVGGAVSQGLVLQFTCSGTAASSNTIYLNGQICGTASGTNNAQFTLPFQSGSYTFMNMYVNYTHAGVATDTVTLYVNGSATSVTCPPTSGTQCSDLTDKASISSGQNYSIRIATHASEMLANVLVTIQLQ